MYTNPSFQRIKLIPANAYCDLESTPLNINFESVDNDSYGHICFHLENAPLAAALVKAINETLAAFAEKPVDEATAPESDAAYRNRILEEVVHTFEETHAINIATGFDLDVLGEACDVKRKGIA